MNRYEAEIGYLCSDGSSNAIRCFVATLRDRDDLMRVAYRAAADHCSGRGAKLSAFQVQFHEVDIADGTMVTILDPDIDASVGAIRLVPARILAALSSLLSEIGPGAPGADESDGLDDLVYEIYGDEVAERANQTADPDAQESELSGGEVKASFINGMGVEIQALTILEAFGPIEGRQRILDAVMLKSAPAP